MEILTYAHLFYGENIFCIKNKTTISTLNFFCETQAIYKKKSYEKFHKIYSIMQIRMKTKVINHVLDDFKFSI